MSLRTSPFATARFTSVEIALVMSSAEVESGTNRGLGSEPRIQKILEDANLKLGSVLSNVLGKSGRAILHALIAGETNPQTLADLAEGTARKKRIELTEALRGRIRDQHRKLLKVHPELVAALEQALADIDVTLGKTLAPIRDSARLLTTLPGVSDLTAQVMVGDRRRHVALPHSGPFDLVVGSLSAQRRKCWKTAL
jgi:hypothetical protein